MNPNHINLKVRAFGNLPTGEKVEEFTLTNPNGVTLKLITYGGIINELHVPDRHGKLADVVLGCRDLAGYLAGHPYFGTITGRVAGRITGGKFRLDGKDYQLVINDPPNHLHGGITGFDKRLWRAEVVNPSPETTGIKLTYFSPHGEEGYPGNLNVAVTYSLSVANEIIIQYEAVTDQATPLSLTNHSYFNLAGEGMGTVEDHRLQIFAFEIALSDKKMTLIGSRAPVAGQPGDFNRAKRFGDALPLLLNSHGDNYLIPHATRKSLERVAVVEDPASGRVLEVLTTEDCVQLYSAAHMDGSLTGKSGQPYLKFAGLCLECQGYPDGVNHPELGEIILRPGETYRQTTIYRFKTS